MEKREKKIAFIIVALLIAAVIGIFVFLSIKIKSSSIMIDVKEEIQLPISVVLEHGEETLVLYESDSIISTKEELISTPDAGEGVVWLIIGNQKYVVIDYLDHVDSPIIEITGDSTSLEVVAYTTMFQTNEDLYEYLTITILE